MFVLVILRLLMFDLSHFLGHVILITFLLSCMLRRSIPFDIRKYTTTHLGGSRASSRSHLLRILSWIHRLVLLALGIDSTVVSWIFWLLWVHLLADTVRNFDSWTRRPVVNATFLRLDHSLAIWHLKWTLSLNIPGTGHHLWTLYRDIDLHRSLIDWRLLLVILDQRLGDIAGLDATISLGIDLHRLSYSSSIWRLLRLLWAITIPLKLTQCSRLLNDRVALGRALFDSNFVCLESTADASWSFLLAIFSIGLVCRTSHHF